MKTMSLAPPSNVYASFWLALLIATASLLMGAVFSASARASDLSTCCTSDLSTALQGTIPSSPTAADCGGVCSAHHIGGGEFVMDCDMTSLGGTSGAQAVAVYDPAGSPNLCTKVGGGTSPYCSVGVDASGTDYYCGWDTASSGDDLAGVNLFGGPGVDTFQFWWDNGSDVFNMDVYSAFAGTSFKGRQKGFLGNDVLQGSRSMDADYQDLLTGGADQDTVCGMAGDDILDGDSQEDLVCGDNGDVGDAGNGTDDCNDTTVVANCESTYTTDPCP